MEAEVKARYPDAKTKLVGGSGGIFDVTCDSKLIYSKHHIPGQRFPHEGEVVNLIEKEKE